MKRINSTSLLALLLLWVISFSMCTRPELQEEDSIELSHEGSLHLPATATKVEVKVNTQSGRWEVINTSSEWIKVGKTPTTLQLEVLDNPTTADRKADLLFLSGKVSKKLTITQEGAENYFRLSATNIDFPFWNSSFTLNLSANGENWKATTDAPWLELTELHTPGQLRVVTSDNPSRDLRQANIHLTTADGSKSQVVRVVQAGRISYILPSFDFLSTALEVRKFEFKRYSALVMVPDGTFNKRFWTYNTDSETFQKISYTIFDDTPKELNSTKQYYKYSEVYANDPNLFAIKREKEGVIRFLQSEGFILNEESGKLFNYEKSVEAELLHESAKSSIRFSYVPLQPKAFPTLKEFPTTHKQVTTKAEMEAYEAENGGVLKLDQSYIGEYISDDMYYYHDPKGGGVDRPVARFYSVKRKTGVVDYMTYYYDTKSIALFEVGGSDFLTDEFKAKMTELGFIYNAEYDHRRYQYIHPNEGIEIFVRWIWYRKNPGALLEIQVQ